MKTSLTFLYDNKTGNIQYIDKTRFIKEFCGSLSQKNNKIIDLQEIKKLNSSTYRDILKKYDKSFLKLSPGIQSTKLNQNTQLILLLDKTTEDFEKYCKKNNWKFGQEVEKLNNISDDIKPNLSLLKNKRKLQESPQKQGIIYSKEKVSLNDSLQKIWQYKPKETKEELKMKNKNIVKKVAVASLAALISIPNIVGSTNTYASVRSDEINEEYTGSSIYLPIRTVVPIGNGLSKFTDDDGVEYICYSNEIQEYQNLVAQGLDHKLDSVSALMTSYKGQSSKGYIDYYQIKGQQSIKLSSNANLSMKDKYTFGPLVVEKYLAGQVSTTNQQAKDLYLLNKNLTEQREKQQAQAIADQQQIDLNNQINAELNTKSENKMGQKTALPYSLDYIKNYVKNQEEISHNKVWASFDNERNYIQQWLTAHGFKSMQELKDYAYKTGVTHYGLQEQVAIQYCKYVEEGKCSTIGDYIRLKFKENTMAEWIQLAKWTDRLSTDFAPNPKGKLICYSDEYKTNQEVYKMIEANLPTIANYTHLNKEEKTKLMEQFAVLSAHWSYTMSTDDLSKQYVNEYESANDFGKKIRNKWNTEYLPNIKE